MKNIYFILLLLFVGCTDKVYRYDFGETVLATSQKELGSNTASTLIATAIKEVHDLDVVFFPSDLLVDSKFTLLKPSMSKNEVNEILGMYLFSLNNLIEDPAVHFHLEVSMLH